MSPQEEITFAAFERAAVNGERCPENDTHGVKSWVAVKLARTGQILIEISGHNFRRVTILVGPHAGKSTAGSGEKHKAWKVIDRNGTHFRHRGNGLPAQGKTPAHRQPSAPRPLTREELAS